MRRICGFRVTGSAGFAKIVRAGLGYIISWTGTPLSGQFAARTSLLGELGIIHDFKNNPAKHPFLSKYIYHPARLSILINRIELKKSQT